MVLVGPLMRCFLAWLCRSSALPVPVEPLKPGAQRRWLSVSSVCVPTARCQQQIRLPTNATSDAEGKHLDDQACQPAGFLSPLTQNHTVEAVSEHRWLSLYLNGDFAVTCKCEQEFPRQQFTPRSNKSGRCTALTRRTQTQTKHSGSFFSPPCSEPAWWPEEAVLRAAQPAPGRGQGPRPAAGRTPRALRETAAGQRKRDLPT